MPTSSARKFGRHKLYEKISPNKTWEGAIGGIVALPPSSCSVVRADPGRSISARWSIFLILAPVGAALGQVGDLAESMLKRSVGVKDSGRIMPGHGGMFDRLDALHVHGTGRLCLYAAGWRGLQLSSIYPGL